MIKIFCENGHHIYNLKKNRIEEEELFKAEDFEPVGGSPQPVHREEAKK